MLQALYASPLRSYLRALGITRLLQLPGRIRGRRRAAAWRRHVGDSVSVEVVGRRVRCAVGSELEYCRVLALKDDAHILGALKGACDRGGVYWDVGANIGLYSAVLSDAVGADGQVFAFEPEPRVQSRLQENLALNGADNVQLVPLGLSDRGGTETFFVSKDGAAGTHSLIAQNPDGDHITIELVTGDDFVRQGNPCPSVIKIDVEGAELSALKGLNRTLRNPTLTTVMCEVHFRVLEESGRETAPQEIVRLLKDAGLSDQTWLDPSHLLARRPQ